MSGGLPSVERSISAWARAMMCSSLEFSHFTRSSINRNSRARSADTQLSVARWLDRYSLAGAQADLVERRDGNRDLVLSRDPCHTFTLSVKVAVFRLDSGALTLLIPVSQRGRALRSASSPAQPAASGEARGAGPCLPRQYRRNQCAELADTSVIVNAVDPDLAATWPGAEGMGARPTTRANGRRTPRDRAAPWRRALRPAAARDAPDAGSRPVSP